MARTTASRGKKSFILKSGNKTTFKMMGSSPMHVDPIDPREIVTMGEEQVVGTRTTETPTSTDITTDYETKGTGYTPPITTPEGDRAYAELTQAEKDAQDAKYIKMATRDIVQQRSATTTTPKPPTEPKKKYKHSKYYDPKTKSYKVRTTDPSMKGKSSDLQTVSDISLADWRKQYGSIKEQRKTTPGTQL